jgi:hypothetical protein
MLITEDGCEMLDMDEEGNPVPISACGVTNGSKITLRIVVRARARPRSG